ncbi:MAG: hypothetical protein [Hatfieldvirus porci]|uniref:Uncharacterized protein n=1 Tax=phage Lak_Megaphage_RVC_JS4_GC31 TaxID=3109228 RepID=A0ABZ0Z5B8_9CAUD|nr:MAG: hypothetical protein [phage Lak_Megaphage_RVC_JS4_GC31]
MVTFRVRNKNVYVERDGVEEFKKNLMTVDEMIDIIMLNCKPEGFSYNKDICYNKIKDDSASRDMLRLFLNNANRVVMKMSDDTFSNFRYGYGKVGDEIKKIVMWIDDYERINFAMYQEDSAFMGHFIKIYVTDGDFYSKTCTDAFAVLAEQVKHRKEEEVKAKQSEEKILTEIREKENTIYTLNKEKEDVSKEIKELATKYIKLMEKLAKLNIKIGVCETNINMLRRKIKKE